MIANCPGCGTHYRHEPPQAKTAARCGRCDASVLLTRLRPYRIVPVQTATRAELDRAARYLPIGLDHPGLAKTIARNVPDPMPSPHGVPVLASVRAAAAMALGKPHAGADVHALPNTAAAEAGSTAESSAGPEGGREVAVLWIAMTSILGIGAGWLMGSATTTGLVAGAALGGATYWVWRRWTSPQ